MNDYNLINALLEDGSEQSLFKVKIIVDFKKLNEYEIKRENRFKFTSIFKDYYSEQLKKYPSHFLFSSIFKYERFEIFLLFKNEFMEIFKKDPYVLNRFTGNEKILVITELKDLFTEIFFNDPRMFCSIPQNKRKQVAALLFPNMEFDNL